MDNRYLSASGKVVGDPEKATVWEAVQEGWFTEGRFTRDFERRLAQWLGARSASFCNSGSSANLLAVLALKEMYAKGDRTEVVTTACGFPTTLNPILQAGLKPVFVDVELATYVPTLDAIMDAVTPRTAFLVLPHTLGNPSPVHLIADACAPWEIGLLEDNCDALGSVLAGRKTGTFGDLATQSFYPAHQITTGEGGAVIINSASLKSVVESYRDWGRDCWCEPGKDNTCGRRFDWQFPGLCEGYDHKYVYSRIGYNFKATDMQAALGLAQMDRLDDFCSIRRINFSVLRLMLSGLEDQFILPVETDDSQPSWFGFPITLQYGDYAARRAIVRDLENQGIGTRHLFGGNLLRQPAYAGMFDDQLHKLPNSDVVAERTFWVGVWPGLDTDDMQRIAEALRKLAKSL